MEYNVTWGEGSLGLTLRAELGDDMPPVVGRITREDSAAALAGVAVGHLLVSVNGIETARRGYDAIVKTLKTIPRPCTLRFRIPKSLVANTRHSDGGARTEARYQLTRHRSAVVDGADREHYFRGDSARSEPNLYLRPPSTHDRTSQHSDRTSNHHRGSGSNNSEQNLPPPVPVDTSSSITTTKSTTSATSSSVRSKRETYTVEWLEGPLGMIFRPDDIDCHIPCIRKITGKGLGSRGIERARVGDILLEINGTTTKDIGFRASISTLKSLQKPAMLKFKRMRRRVSRSRDKESSVSAVPAVNGTSLPPTIPEEEPAVLVETVATSFLSPDAGLYDIVWREGELGLKLKPTPSDVPMISRLTGKGSASGLHNANVGDVLATVNGKSVSDASYTSTLRLLKHTPKPIILRFCPTTRDIALPNGNISAPTSKRDQIPLDVAKQLVATSQGLDPMKDEFAGVPMKEISEGSKEANYLRVAAKAFVAIQADQKRGQTRAELTRAEREAQVLAEALEQLKEQAKKYEEMLAKQKVERILRPATENKSKAVIAKANNLFAELKSSVNFVRRDSVDFTDIDVNQDHLDKMREDMLKDLSTITQTTSYIPASAQKSCFQCAALESLTLPFYLDDSDNQWYCETCWVQYYGDPVIEQVVAIAEVVEELPESITVELPEPVAVEEPESIVAVAPVSTNKPGFFRRPCTKEDLIMKELEEKQAQKEAEKMLKELMEMKRNSGVIGTGSFSGSAERLSQPSSDRLEREKRGKEELARQLHAEEEKAKALGNESLAKKLEAQRKRSMADALDTGDDVNTMGSLLRSKSEGATPTFMRENSSLSSPTRSEDESIRTFDDDEDDAYEEEEEYDQDTELLHNREDQNFAMAKELQRMHEVVHQAHRMSMMMLGEDDEVSEFTGLSDDQVNLFKKLALESDHRVSLATQEYFSAQGDDDSDSEGSDDDGEGDDGVWI